MDYKKMERTKDLINEIQSLEKFIKKLEREEFKMALFFRPKPILRFKNRRFLLSSEEFDIVNEEMRKDIIEVLKKNLDKLKNELNKI